MFCLDCGTKINENERVCSNCGLTLEEMQKRLEKAQEMITYADTVGPLPTEKLPLVVDRVYIDDDGNEIKPEEDARELAEKKRAALQAIPSIGQVDPYITVPIQKIVSDRGEIVADIDRNAKVFSQEVSKKKFNWKKLIVLLLMLVLCLVAAYLVNTNVISLSIWAE